MNKLMVMGVMLILGASLAFAASNFDDKIRLGDKKMNTIGDYSLEFYGNANLVCPSGGCVTKDAPKIGEITFQWGLC